MLTSQVWNIDSIKAEKATVIKKIQELCPEAEFQAVFYKRKYNQYLFTNTYSYISFKTAHQTHHAYEGAKN
jgi:hypothetical protein